MLHMEGLEKTRKTDQLSSSPEKSAREAGREAGEERLQKISGLFSGITEKIKKGAVFTLGTPEMVVAKTAEVSDRVRNRIAEAHQNLQTKYERGKQATKERVQATKDKAKQWGLSVVAPVEDRILSTWNVPKAFALEYGARRAGRRAEKSETRKGTAELAYGTEIAKLEARIAELKELMEAEVAVHREGHERSRGEMWEKLLAARDRREKVGRARATLEELKKAA